MLRVKLMYTPRMGERIPAGNAGKDEMSRRDFLRGLATAAGAAGAGMLDVESAEAQQLNTIDFIALRSSCKRLVPDREHECLAAINQLEKATDVFQNADKEKKLAAYKAYLDALFAFREQFPEVSKEIKFVPRRDI